MTIHRYYDVSLLNAPYARPHPIGIGQTEHVYDDMSNLNARYDEVPLRGIGHLGAGSLGMSAIGSLGRSLGQEQAFPWREYSDATKELQGLVNQALKKNGYCPVGTDGKLGPLTCGAIALIEDLDPESGVFTPNTCQEFKRPGKEPCAAAPAPTVEPPPIKKAGFGISGDVLWIAGGFAVAAASIGAALWYKKKKG